MGNVFSPDVPSAPGPSPELQNLYEAQRQQIEEQRKIAQQMNAVQMQALGFQEDPATGEWVKAALSAEEQATQERSNKIRQLLQERQIAALEGTNEVSPALEKELEDEKRKVEEEIRRGPGLNSTTGRQRLSILEERHANIREASRRNDIVTLEQLLSGRTTQELQQQQFATGGLLNVGQQRISNFQAISGAYGVAMQPWLLQQQQQGQYEAMKYQNKLNYGNMLIKAGAGAAVGGIIGGPTGAAIGAGSAIAGSGPAYSYQVYGQYNQSQGTQQNQAKPIK